MHRTLAICEGAAPGRMPRSGCGANQLAPGQRANRHGRGRMAGPDSLPIVWHLRQLAQTMAQAVHVAAHQLQRLAQLWREES